MYTVKYEKYYNDYRKSQEVKTFCSLEEVADWLFGMVRGEYSKSVLFLLTWTIHGAELNVWIPAAFSLGTENGRTALSRSRKME